MMLFTLSILTIFTTSILLLGLVNLFLRQRLYKEPKANNTQTKKCSIILPCKGLPKGFTDNILSFFTLEHPDYEVLTVVESEEDAAYPILQELLADKDNGKVVVAGLTTGGCQKNHNLLAAVKETKNPHYLVFADSDIKLKPNWLQTITAPLSSDKITAVTGFRWLYSEDGKAGSHAHSFQNYILFALFSLSSAFANRGLWGGSTAIRKTDFDNLDVEKRWRETGVDDLSLSELLYKKKKKTVLSYNCITPTTDTISNISNVTNWYKRQVMYLKYHQKIDWYGALGMTTILLLAYLTLPVSLVSLSMGNTFAATGGWIGVGVILFSILYAIPFPLFGDSKKSLHFILYAPLSLITIIIAVLSTLFTNDIYWSGYKYTIHPQDGTVSNIERL